MSWVSRAIVAVVGGELTRSIGSVARQHCAALAEPELDRYLELVQSVLLDVGAHVATPRSDSTSTSARLGTEHVPNVACAAWV